MLRFAGSALVALSTALTAAAVAQTRPVTPANASSATDRATPAPNQPGGVQSPERPSPPPPSAAELNARLAAPLPADQAAMKAHVMFLASDPIGGREAGTPQFDVAAQYVASQFYAAGLRPAGDEGGYLQRVPLFAYKLADGGTATWTAKGGAATPLVFQEDYVPSPNPAAAKTSVSGEVVFVGYGISAPELGIDDYKGVDVRGKIVAFVGGTPPGLQSEESAVLGQAATKAAAASAKGAIGALTLTTRAPNTMQAAQMNRLLEVERVTWTTASGMGNSPVPSTPILATLLPAGATKLFGAAEWAKIAAAVETKPKSFTPVAASGRMSFNSATTSRPLPSSNVVGIIPGSDPKLKDEVVVLSAHLDHIGTLTRGDGDRINNGALDNAIGIASLIEEAKRFTASGKAPRRTVMFLAVTAEEKGLVGAEYFANNPTVPLKNIVANVNLDMPILTYKFEDMVVFGAERSTLGPIVRRAVESAGVSLSPDPSPEQSFFTRSDHFRFVQKGVPSVFLWPGQKGVGKAAFDAFLTNCYHRPCDDLTLPILWDQGPRFVDVNYRIAREIADGDQRPVWNKGDYFGTIFKGPMAK